MSDTADAKLRELHRVFPGRVAIRERKPAPNQLPDWFSLEIRTWTTAPIVWQGDDVSDLIAKAHRWMRPSF